MANKEATLLLRIKEIGGAILDRFVITLGDVIDIAGKLYDAMAKPIEAFREQEEAVNSLTRSMINQGIYSSDLKNTYLQQASALQSLTTFGDEQIIGAQGILQAFVGQREVSQDLVKATLDLAAAKKMDLASAAELVGKTIGTETNALARHGVEVDSHASKQEKLSQVIDGIERKWRGQAEAQAKGLGATIQFKNAVSDLLEVIGQRLAPYVETAARKFTEYANNITGWIEKNVQATDSSAVLGNEINVLKTKISNLQSQMGSGIGIGFLDALSDKGRIATIDALKAKLVELSEQKKLLDAEESERKRQSKESDGISELDEINRQNLLKLEQDQVFIDQMIAQAGLGATAKQSAILAAEIKGLEARLAAETDLQKKADIQKQINAKKMQLFQSTMNEMEKQDRLDTLNNLAQLQHSKNKEMAAIGKAAAIVQIGIATFEGSVKAYNALAGIPYVGPALGAAAAAALTAYGLERASAVAGIQLAEGGIVMPRAGGIQATIGEGGQAEAVIPLDRAGEFGLGGGGGIQIIVYGGLLGDESSAREFARAVDRELLNLRKNNESVSFDSGVI